MRKIHHLIGLLIVLSLVQSTTTSFAAGKIYTWVDKQGVTRFTDYPPPPGEVLERSKRTKSRPQNVTSPKVELFVTSWCPYCKKAQDFFRSRGIAYVAYDIEKDKRAAARKNQLDRQGGVPFAVINGRFIRGFVPEQYVKALRLQ